MSLEKDTEQRLQSLSPSTDAVKTKRILLVEDDRMLRDMLAMDLQESGAQIQTAIDGQEALELIQRQQPDLLLLDLLMPRKDGFAVLQALKEANYRFPIVIISNLSSPEEASKCFDLGAQDFIVKSELDVGELWGRIQKYL